MRNLLSGLLLISLLTFPQFSRAQCADGQSAIHVVVIPDSWPQEISWELLYNDGDTIASGGANTDTTYCISADSCLTFWIHDQYGDGIYAPGGYWLYVDSQLVAHGDHNTYTHHAFNQLNCPPGTSCDEPISITEGTYTTPYNSAWYAFIPELTGEYHVTTCDLNGTGCDTKVAVYEYCDMNNFNDTQQGTIGYDDNYNGCDSLASVTVPLEANHVYYIRVWEVEGCGGHVTFDVGYNGPVVGCMDSTACNFNPLATISSNDCVYPGDPGCDQGPDLEVVQQDLRNSIYASTITVGPDNCYISEGCLNGYGARQIIRFTTHIKNIGTMDYYIGNPTDHPDQFSWGNCHHHWHYEGYANYTLFDTAGTEIPIGFKFGFCVLDLECSGGGTGQFGCNNMGISHGCGDIYNSGLDCQWIDVTDVPDGDYTLAVQVNYDHSPDALGHYEMTYENNWATVCLNIDRSSGSMQVTTYDNCSPVLDCAGIPFGNSMPDCAGVCNGTRLRGDLDTNNVRNQTDAQMYISGILDGSLEAMACNDLNSDTMLTVMDAALVNRCYLTMEQNQDTAIYVSNCDFPKPHVVNPFDQVTFTIGQLNTDAGYFDVYFKNPNKRIVGYEFDITGCTIDSIQNLVGADYPATLQFNGSNGRVIGLSLQDSSVARSNTYQPLCRIYYSNPMEEICIGDIVDVVNESYESSTTHIEEGCATITGLSHLKDPYITHVAPNPMTDQAVLTISNWMNDEPVLDLIDLSGRIVRHYGPMKSNRIVINRGDLSDGTYFYRLSGKYIQQGKLVISN